MSYDKRKVPSVKEWVIKLPFKFDIDKLIEAWDYVTDTNNFDHEGFDGGGQLGLVTSELEYEGKNPWYECTGSMHHLYRDEGKRQLEEKDFIVFNPLLEDTYFYYVYNELSTMYDIGRVRLMNFPSKMCLSWHMDLNERIHVPIITNSGCHLVIENNVYHLPADGSSYIADVTPPHTAFNGGWDNRYNLLLDVLGYKDGAISPLYGKDRNQLNRGAWGQI